MKLIDDATATTSPPAPPSDGTEGAFTGGNPATAQAATRVRYWWLNLVQGMLRGLTDVAGVTASKTGFANGAEAVGRIASAKAGTTITSSRALTLADAGIVFVDASGGSVALTLPAANAQAGIVLPTGAGGGTLPTLATRFTVVRLDTTYASAVTIQRAGGDTVNGGTSVSVGVGRTVSVFSNGVSTWTAHGFSGAMKVNAGSPNGSVAGSAGSGTIPPDLCYDTTGNALYVCTTSGNAAGAVWTQVGYSAAQAQVQGGNYATDSGTANALVATLSPVPASLASLAGSPVRIKKGAAANSGAATLNLNGLGAASITWPDGTAGDLPANAILNMVCTGTAFVLVGVGRRPAQLADFTFSAASSGYATLPSGLIVQWGSTSTGNIVNITSFAATFPITFPNACLTAMGTLYNSGTANTQQQASLTDIRFTASGLTAYIEEWSTPVQTVGARYVAIGY